MKDRFNKDLRAEKSAASGSGARHRLYKYHRVLAFLRPVLLMRTTHCTTVATGSGAVLQPAATDPSQPSSSAAPGGSSTLTGDQGAGPSGLPLSQSSFAAPIFAGSSRQRQRASDRSLMPEFLHLSSVLHEAIKALGDRMDVTHNLLNCRIQDVAKSVDQLKADLKKPAHHFFNQILEGMSEHLSPDLQLSVMQACNVAFVQAMQQSQSRNVAAYPTVPSLSQVNTIPTSAAYHCTATSIPSTGVLHYSANTMTSAVGHPTATTVTTAAPAWTSSADTTMTQDPGVAYRPGTLPMQQDPSMQYRTGPPQMQQDPGLAFRTGPTPMQQDRGLSYLTGPTPMQQDRGLSYLTGPTPMQQDRGVAFRAGHPPMQQDPSMAYRTGPPMMQHDQAIPFQAGPTLMQQDPSMAFCSPPPAMQQDNGMGFVSPPPTRHQDPGRVFVSPPPTRHQDPGGSLSFPPLDSDIAERSTMETDCVETGPDVSPAHTLQHSPRRLPPTRKTQRKTGKTHKKQKTLIIPPPSPTDVSQPSSVSQAPHVLSPIPELPDPSSFVAHSPATSASSTVSQASVLNTPQLRHSTPSRRGSTWRGTKK
ncbi:uncharacterized protein LOC143798324 [Ranitomeya variabilis]|uniref:uncharacterized protein LOC143798324 n=1 Tax=Ranitomeya variabilis TaxID=490064 RepID=UPI0040559ED0